MTIKPWGLNAPVSQPREIPLIIRGPNPATARLSWVAGVGNARLCRATRRCRQRPTMVAEQRRRDCRRCACPGYVGKPRADCMLLLVRTVDGPRYTPTGWTIDQGRFGQRRLASSPPRDGRDCDGKSPSSLVVVVLDTWVVQKCPTAVTGGP